MEISQPRSMTLIWASLMSDNEVLITNFLSTGRWDYKTFASIMKTFHTTAVFNLVVTKGKMKDVHLITVCHLILCTAKEVWLNPTAPLREVLRTAMQGATEAELYPFSCAVGPPLDEYPEGLWERAKAKSIETRELVGLKKRLGGFYLLYTLFYKQPYECGTLIPMTRRDYESFEQFETALKRLFPYGDRIWIEYRFLLNRLKVSNAFESQFEDDSHDTEHGIRMYLNTKRDKNVELLQLCKQLQDENSHDATPRAATCKLLDYSQSKANLIAKLDVEDKDDMAQEPLPKTAKKEDSDDKEIFEQRASEAAETTAILESLRTSTVEMSDSISEVLATLKMMGDTPIFTRSSLLGNATVERVFSTETNKRKIRVENKEKKSTTAQRYDRDIFGSQKVEQDDDDDDGVLVWNINMSRGRSQAANNLWSYYIPENFEFQPPDVEELYSGVRVFAFENKKGQGPGSKDAKGAKKTEKRGVERPKKSDETGSKKNPKKNKKTTGKKVGRPRKAEQTATAAAVDITRVGDVTSTHLANAEGSASKQMEPKRKRGRPRKSDASNVATERVTTNI